MQPPKIEIIPARPAVCRDQPAELDVLVRIIPPVPEVHFLRPPINLGIVLDRSGSMAAERKMEHAREAAIFAVSQLLPTDRVSITIYDEVVETIVPSEPVVDKPGLVTRIRGIMPRGSTNLLEGWATGAGQVVRARQLGGLEPRVAFKRRPGQCRGDRPQHDPIRSGGHGHDPGQYQHIGRRQGIQ